MNRFAREDREAVSLPRPSTDQTDQARPAKRRARQKLTRKHNGERQGNAVR